MDVYVKHDEAAYAVSVTADVTVDGLKDALEKQGGPQAWQQRLFFAGTELNHGGEKLSDMGAAAESAFELVAWPAELKFDEDKLTAPGGWNNTVSAWMNRPLRDGESFALRVGSQRQNAPKLRIQDETQQVYEIYSDEVESWGGERRADVSRLFQGKQKDHSGVIEVRWHKRDNAISYVHPAWKDPVRVPLPEEFRGKNVLPGVKVWNGGTATLNVPPRKL